MTGRWILPAGPSAISWPSPAVRPVPSAVVPGAAAAAVSTPLVVLGARAVPQQRLERRQGVCQERGMPASLHGKPQRSVEARNFVETQSFRLSLSQPDSRYRLSSLDLVIEGDSIAPNVETAGQCLEPLAGDGIDELGRLKDYSSALKIVPAPDLVELLPHALAQPLRSEL